MMPGTMITGLDAATSAAVYLERKKIILGSAFPQNPLIFNAFGGVKKTVCLTGGWI
jgi:hypothetical protein